MSAPSITNIDSIDGKMMFDLMNVDVSVANGIRRVLLSNIDNLVFQAFPHEECSINITKNNTKFNNEYLKQRISCIPVHNGWQSLMTDRSTTVSPPMVTRGPTTEVRMMAPGRISQGGRTTLSSTVAPS